MSAEPPLPRSRVRVVTLVAVVAGALLAAGGLVALVADPFGAPDQDETGQWQPPATPTATAATPTPQGTQDTEGVAEDSAVSLSATGDIILGDSGSLPPDDGAGFFDDVASALDADLVMGNLEEPLTEDTGHRKCPEGSDACHAFRAPPGYASHLRDGGFDLMNIANNHGNDFGPDGRDNTRQALEEQDIAHTGERDQITVTEAGDVSVAVVGFSPYSWTNALNDHDQAADVVTRADSEADLVVVQAHMGAEGHDQTRVDPGSEEFFGENRGDPMAFSRAVIDAGADLVVGHGPHVLRGMEFYDGRLIAYSLGNFAGGGGTLSANGNLGLGGVLRVTLAADGTFTDGAFVSTDMRDRGLPRVDDQQRSLALVEEVTEQDFPDSGAQFDSEGVITPPAGSP